jgi:hypothetical protein
MLTIRVDGKEAREVVLPGRYLDGRQRGERNRRMDLAYATTGHRAQGLTRWRALVRLTGLEDSNWLYVQLSRARQDTRLYAVVGPEPQGQPNSICPTGSQATAMPSSLRSCPAPATSGWRSTRPAPRICAGCPPPSCGPNATASAACWIRRRGIGHGGWRGPAPAGPRPSRPWSSSPPPTNSSARATGCFACGGGTDPPSTDRAAALVARQQADRAADTEVKLRQHQQARAGWLEANASLGPAYQQVVRELAWQRRARGLALEREQPGYLRGELGPLPERTPGAAVLAAGRRRHRGLPPHL